MKRRIVFHLGGPAFHPVDQQAALIAQWLGPDYDCQMFDGVDAFEHLDGCDLLVLMGLHWTAMPTWQPPLPYRPLEPRHLDAFRGYVTSGRPLLAHHGAVASYDDTPQFGRLVGVTWVWNYTAHSPFGTYTMRAASDHPVVAGVNEYTLDDEIYYALALNADMRPQVHASVAYEGLERPMVITAEGGRVAGAGKLVYLANGHDMKAMQCPALRTLWTNSVRWLLQ